MESQEVMRLSTIDVTLFTSWTATGSKMSRDVVLDDSLYI